MADTAADHRCVILDLPPLTILLYEATQQAVLMGPGRLTAVSLPFTHLVRVLQRTV